MVKNNEFELLRQIMPNIIGKLLIVQMPLYIFFLHVCFFFNLWREKVIIYKKVALINFFQNFTITMYVFFFRSI